MGSFLKIALPLAAIAAPMIAPAAFGSLAAGLGVPFSQAGMAGGGFLSGLGGLGSVLNAVSSAQGLFGGGGGETSAAPRQKAPSPAQEAQFVPRRPEEMQRPDSLSELAAYSPQQQRSALATRGVNTGLGSEEENYYKNLLQRSLIGENNKVDIENPNFLMPIEGQYFSQRGVNTSDPLSFLKGLGY